MEKIYDPSQIEQKWYQTWEKNGYFKPSGSGEPYCIMIPPPNVTGTLHMGHGFQNSLMDALIRYHRMLGKDTLWQVGTDHAGIATQMVVERKLLEQGITRHELGRENFVKKIWEWRHESGGTITQQLRRLGASVDWSRECFTMDEELSHKVQLAFIKLYEEGLIYRGKRLVNWDPVLKTAISDLEVLSQEETGHLWHLKYPLCNCDDELVVATTRPETMLGDVAVAVHPDDPRYQHLIGEKVQLPLTDRIIPIIADEYVDPEFGSGCVKITPAHDFNDYAIGQRHHLPMINVFTEDAKLNEEVPHAYRGLDRFAAREKIIADLTALGLIKLIEEHKLTVPRGEKSGAIIEPYLTNQWFVKIEPLVKPAVDVVQSGKIKFVPENWSKIYFQWMDKIEDWCISRQLWWGHRIPAWYSQDGEIYVGESEQAVREKYHLSKDFVLTQDEDVLDTWFSSALWPFTTLGGPEATPEIKRYYPTAVLVTGFDIIFFWVARMIMMGLKFMDEIPFHTVYITGLIRDAEGHKMSKSKGNIIDPIDLVDGIDLEPLIKKRTRNLMQPHLEKQIEKLTRQEFPQGIPTFGTDSLRFTYCALASTGRNIRFDLARIEGYRNFCNKLWNAARYVLMNTENDVDDLKKKEVQFSLADRWILSALQDLITEVTKHFKEYRFDLLAHAIYDFIWGKYCDWYLELSKVVLYDEQASTELKRGTRQTLVQVLETTLRLLHPLMPFITEEIWQRVAPLAGKRGSTIMLQPYPKFDSTLVDEKTKLQAEWLQQIITALRTIRSEMNINPQQQITLLVRHWTPGQKMHLEKYKNYLMMLSKVKDFSFLAKDTPVPPAATALVGELELFIPMTDLIDKAAETARLQKEIKKIDQELIRSQDILNKPGFKDRAPQAVVKKEEARQEELLLARKKLNEQLVRVEKM